MKHKFNTDTETESTPAVAVDSKMATNNPWNRKDKAMLIESDTSKAMDSKPTTVALDSRIPTVKSDTTDAESAPHMKQTDGLLSDEQLQLLVRQQDHTGEQNKYITENHPDEWFAMCILAMPERDQRRFFRDFNFWDEGVKKFVDQRRFIAKVIYKLFMAPEMKKGAAA